MIARCGDSKDYGGEWAAAGPARGRRLRPGGGVRADVPDGRRRRL